MDPKALKKLVKTCREMGIKHYKGDGFEFELTAEAPVKRALPRKSAQERAITDEPQTNPDFDTDTLTEDQILMWSVQEDSDNQFEIGR